MSCCNLLSEGALQARQDDCIVRVKNLCKSIRSKLVLDNVDLDLRAGEMLALIGPDGSGKSTLMHILSGIQKFDRGTVRVLGMLPQDAKSKLGFMSQRFSLYPDLTVEENLRYVAGLHNLQFASVCEEMKEHLESMGLLAFRHRLVSKLSGGMKRKLALCAALITRPELLLMDEPSFGVDPVSQQEFWRLIEKSRLTGLSVAFSTQYWQEGELADCVGLLYRGRMLRCGSPGKLKSELGLQRLEFLAWEREAIEFLLDECGISSQTRNLYSSGERTICLVPNSFEFGPKLESLARVSVEELSLENVFQMHMQSESSQSKLRFDIPFVGHKQVGEGAAIVAEHIGKQYGEFKAVVDLSLRVHFGEVYALLGANGAGKTTSLKILTGLLSPSKGRMEILGQTEVIEWGKLRAQMGYMSQDCTLYEDLTVAENLEFYASLYKVPANERQSRFDWIANACGIIDLQTQLVSKLPSGSKQRVSFAASVLHLPRLLFLDEPSAGMDPAARRELWQLIDAFSKFGTAIILTTHLLDEIAYCSRLGVLSNGIIIAEGSPLEVQGAFSSLEEAILDLFRRKDSSR